MLKIDVVSYQGKPMANPISAVFNGQGGDIGRNPDCFLALPDPLRHLSRQHAQIDWRSDGYLIKNATANNYVVVNGHTLHANEFCLLEEGHQIYIGHYLLEVAALDISAVAPPEAMPEAVVSDHQEQQAHDQHFFDATDPLAFDAPENISHPPLNPSEAALLPVADDVFPEHANAPHQQQFSDDPFAILNEKSDASLPADPLINPAALNLAQIEPERRAAAGANPFDLASLDARNARDPLFDHSGKVSLDELRGRAKNIDELYSDSTPSLPGLDPLADLEPVHALGAFETHKSLDPLALFAADSGTVQSLLEMTPSVVMDDHSDQLVMHLDLPRAMLEEAPAMISPQPGETSVADTPIHVIAHDQASANEMQHAAAGPDAAPDLPPATATQAATSAPAAQMPLQGRRAADATPMTQDEHRLLIEAFLNSAGLPREMVPQRLTPEFMGAVGAMLFTAMQGTVDLIAARAATKREVKAEMTLILPVQNNPLKFVPDGKAALIHMFGKQIPGFLGPIDAMRDAYQDLRAHQVGVFAGMRAALAEVLQRFSPADVEKRLDQLSMIDNLMPSHRKAKLWDLYGQQFKKIYAEAEEDFDVIFGDAFAVAYEEQTKSMRVDSASSGQ